ncbi:hypothetical protein PFICI_04693 [Pestalotiopsis fici W106-1]|uniref:Mid2 domain-containing protein n=1 Tax=Pestalotiopsis fici (strain W106-1 / CGMCC3.15140) TaxID=1229662 RepID=W3XBL6_PESFW|nr:uncharacterized protein PFICI_04693 [Pestalotiopsis fici W106-1]ETS82817.1 hypothetical protein PFICI_04693 [Pestalotiopsis fici W106-1]
MRSLLLIACAAGSTSAAWLKWTDHSTPTWKPPQETGVADIAGSTTGWTPKPTQGPGHRSKSEVVLELLRRDATTDWTNSKTCGWFSGISSQPWTCDGNQVCATNSEHAVACVSGDYNPFYVTCLNREAYEQGSCADAGPKTGCCSEATASECVTYMWTGSPVRSQFKCGTATAITTLLDEPQFVIDASISASKASESASKASASAASESASRATLSTSTLSDGTVVVTTANPLTSAPVVSTTSNNTTNVGAIVGGAVGGLVFLILLLLLCCCRRRRKSKKNNYNVSYKRSNNEKTTVYNNQRRDKRRGERSRSERSRQHDRKASRGRSHKSRPKEVVSDDESYKLGFVDGFSGQNPAAPRQAHVVDDDRTVYAPQYHFHVAGGARPGRESSIVETTEQYHAM